MTKTTIPKHSMYAIYAYIDPSNHSNVGIYGIHGVSGTVTRIRCVRVPWDLGRADVGLVASPGRNCLARGFLTAHPAMGAAMWMFLIFRGEDAISKQGRIDVP